MAPIANAGGTRTTCAATASETKVASRFEFATEADPALSYCLWEYPRPAVATDKFRSINLLLHSFELAGIDGRAFEIVEALREGIGDFRTVYGVKFSEGKFGWEFYFYDYKRRDRDVSATKVIEAIRPWVRCGPRLTETLPYFMFSLDLDDDLARGKRPLDVIHMYIGNPGSAVSSGIAYAVREHSTTLENFYFFFDAQTELSQAMRKVETSAVVDVTRVDMDEILVPNLRNCRTICVANKAAHDCAYFSGVDVDQLLFFLEHMQYPSATRAFVAANRERLDHLLFDVGIDYAMRDGRLVALKSAYYGVF